MTLFATSTGIAKPIPTLAPVGLKMAVLMPIIFPEESIKGPPEFPGLMEASVWMTSSTRVPPDARMVRPTELITPVVRVWPRPKGLPMAMTFCPTLRLSEDPMGISTRSSLRGFDLDDRNIGVGIGPDQFRVKLLAVGQGYFKLAGIFDDMMIRQDIATSIDNGPGAGSLPGNYVEEEVVFNDSAGDVYHAWGQPLVDLDIVLFILGQGERHTRPEQPQCKGRQGHTHSFQ